MSDRIALKVEVCLMSDAIIGSGYSVPGAEDIGICFDDTGYPYLRGTTVKGLLRESMINYLCWTNGDTKTVSEVLGKEGWDSRPSARRIHITDFYMKDQPEFAEDSQRVRIFTKIGSNGVVEPKTLRVANTIQSGHVFSGDIVCSREDKKLLTESLRYIKWLGTMRSRGLGRVCITCEETKYNGSGEQENNLPEDMDCIYYRLKALAPLSFTDLANSSENTNESRKYIPGSAIRGLVVNKLAQTMSSDMLSRLLSDRVRFLNALPNPTEYPVIPSIKGFYENKQQTQFETVVKNGDFSSGLKRAKLGSCCSIQNGKIVYWSAKTGGTTRIKRSDVNTKDNKPFRTNYLSANQEFEGYILADHSEHELLKPIMEALGGELWIGADRHGGFGKCQMSKIEPVKEPHYADAYKIDEPSEDMYLLLLSPAVMYNAYGEFCGLDCAAIAEMLGVSSVEIKYCSTSISEYGGFNRKRANRESAVRMYDAGSVFHLKLSEKPDAEKLTAMMDCGIGIKRAEGCGQVLFISAELFDSITGKEKWETKTDEDCKRKASAEGRRKRLIWIMDNHSNIKKGNEYYGFWSDSIVGDLQQQCEKAMAKNNVGLVEEWIRKRKTKLDTYRNPEHRKNANENIQYIEGLLSNRDLPCKDDELERIRLICDMLDFGRKKG